MEASDDNGAPDGVRSWVRFPVTRGEYLVAVDGVNGASGDIKLNWKLGLFAGDNGAAGQSECWAGAEC